LNVEADRTRIVIASPLEQEHVARIAAAAGDRTEVVHALDLLPPARYIADHDGPEDFARAPAHQQRWLDLLASADVLFGLPREAKGD
jgi:hypothetical protein